MKKILSLFIVFALIVGLACGCSVIPEDLKYCEVNFFVDGQLYDTKTVAVGQSVRPPVSPEKKNEIFVAWGTEGIISYEYDFSSKVITDMNLYAYFVIDAISLTNMITEEAMKSIVTIETRCYNTIGSSNVESNYQTSQGSGVVIDISDGCCYVLTNHHVVEMLDGYSKQSFTVEDPWGNDYEAQIYRKSARHEYAMSEEYDLALLCFRYNPTDKHMLEEIGIGEDPKVHDYVVALGTPSGLKNAITYGSVLEYGQIKAGDDESLKKVKFDVVIHNAPLDHGSSGGALLNTGGYLVGINFAGYNDGTYGCSIPISKVLEFLNVYVYR